MHSVFVFSGCLLSHIALKTTGLIPFFFFFFSIVILMTQHRAGRRVHFQGRFSAEMIMPILVTLWFL